MRLILTALVAVVLLSGCSVGARPDITVIPTVIPTAPADSITASQTKITALEAALTAEKHNLVILEDAHRAFVLRMVSAALGLAALVCGVLVFVPIFAIARNLFIGLGIGLGAMACVCLELAKYAHWVPYLGGAVILGAATLAILAWRNHLLSGTALARERQRLSAELNGNLPALGNRVETELASLRGKASAAISRLVIHAHG